MMKPGVYNIEARAGWKTSLQLHWKDETGTAVNLTGYTALMEIRHRRTNLAPVLVCSTGNGKVVLGGSTHNITVDLDFTGVMAGEYVYTLVLSSAGVSYPLLVGRVALPEI